MNPTHDFRKRLLRDLQTDFRLTSRPFLHFAGKFGVEETEILKVIRDLFKEGKIRRIGANFESRALGYVSTLAGVSVEPDFLESVAAFVSRHPGVTHNYERLHEFNLWFTLTVPSEEAIQSFLEQVRTQKGVKKILKLPVVEYYKLNVSLDPETGQNLAKPSTQHPAQAGRHSFSEKEKALIRVVQTKIPLCSRPFQSIGEEIGWTEETVLKTLKDWKANGVIRKIGAILNHRRVGVSANAMVVWEVPETRASQVGQTMADIPQVSHCYRRVVYPEWPYSHYTMIHAADPDSLQNIIRNLSTATGIRNYLILKSGREFKKVGMRYFEETV
ncbi:MAG: Lrp/AsnC family transcriptional regulator [Calditrichaeota bacterium]|nr:Lrp/AsnC family transcriptional regulator [Calditrichota bacterium]